MEEVIVVFKTIGKVVAYSIGAFLLGIFGIVALIVYIVDRINLAILD